MHIIYICAVCFKTVGVFDINPHEIQATCPYQVTFIKIYSALTFIRAIELVIIFYILSCNILLIHSFLLDTLPPLFPILPPPLGPAAAHNSQPQKDEPIFIFLFYFTELI